MLTEEHYNEVRASIAEKIKTTNAAALTTLDNAMALSFQEHIAYQNLQSRAFAAGKICLEVAQRIYQALGEGFNADSNGGWQPHVVLEDKIVITKLMAELIVA